MSDTTAPSPDQQALARYDLDLVNIRKAMDERDKLSAEARKLEAEFLKLRAEELKLRAEELKMLGEARKLTRDVAFIPYDRILVFIGAVGGLAAVLAHFMK